VWRGCRNNIRNRRQPETADTTIIGGDKLIRRFLPQIAIVLIGLIGFIIWGLWGLIGGLVGGYIVVSLFGLILVAVSGGILPQKARKQAAREFYARYAQWLVTKIPDNFRGQEIQYIEKLLERIYKKAAVIGPFSSSGMSLAEVTTAVDIIKNEESSQSVVDIVDHLYDYLVDEWYFPQTKE